ncbi:MAG: lipase maturation factor family protein [Phycisphaerales bacterium]|nr:lipase maturation factor family protein [Phycisphaerales bacterium]
MGCGECKSCEGGPCRGLLPEAELPTNLPLVVYDGDCGFCRRWLKRYEAVSPPDRLAWAPYQKAAGQFPGIPESAFAEAIHLVQPDGSSARGAEAVYEIMDRVDVRSWPLRLYRWLPPFRGVSNLGYRLVANHRGGAAIGGKLLWGKIQVPSTTLLTRRVFLRLLGLIYLIAMLSIGYQMDGLFGPEGLRPFENYLELVAAHGGSDRPFFTLPTTMWFGGTGMLEATWITGVVASTALLLGLVPMLSMALAWFAYLSIVNIAGIFMSYQWDVLLLEIGFLAIFWAPCAWRLNSPAVRRPSTVLRWMLIWLLLRFMFLSGWLKLASQDSAWWDLTALDYHYWTQPLPLWTAWYAWQLPMWWQKLSCLLMFIIELGIPFLILFPRIPRLIAFTTLVLLQVGILLSGNYGFFNWLTIVLCVVLLDDSQLLWMWPRRARGLIRVGLARRECLPRRSLNTLVAALLLSMSIPLTMMQLSDDRSPRQRPALAGWHLVNGYGLFRVMTKTRPEILIEGSADGVTWEPYVFRWKPGPLDRAPAWCQPDMPRLDWQLWFDGLDYEYLAKAGVLDRRLAGIPSVDGSQVLPDLVRALAEDRADVIDLLESSPFPAGEPPRYLRWHLDLYRFTTSSQRDETGDWWTRERLYSSPPLSLNGPGSPG